MILRSVLHRSFVLLLLGLSASATPAQFLKPGEWRTYTSMTNVADILITPDSGIVWVATDGGVYHVPLANVTKETVVELRNSDGLRENDCSALALAPNGDILIGDSSGGINVYHPRTGTFDIITDIAGSTQFPHRQISRLVVHDSTLFVATGFGLSIYNLNSSAFATTVTRFGNWTLQDTVFDVALVGDTIYTILSGALAYAPRNSPLLSAPFAWTVVRAPSGVSLRTLAAFDGTVVVGSMQGLWKLIGDSLAFVATNDSVSVVRLVRSAAGDELFALDARGSSLVSTRDLKNFSSTALVRSSKQGTASVLFITASGAKLTGFNSGGITVETGGTPNIGFSPDGPLTNDVTDLVFDRGKSRLFGLYGSNGLTLFDPTTSAWKLFPADGNPLPQTGYLRMFWDTIRSTLWLGTFGDGIYGFKFDPSFSYVRRSDADGLPTLYPNTVIAQRANLDNKGNLLVPVWAGDGRGLAISSDALSFHAVQLNPPGGWRPFGEVIQDLDGYYYVATLSWDIPQGFGMSIVVPNGSDTTIYQLLGGTSGQLASESIDAMVLDQDNGLWCGEPVGVQVVSHSLDFQSGAPVFHVRTLRFLDQQIVHAIAVDGVGNKWVGTQDGVFVVSPDGTDSLAHFTTSNSPLIDNTVTAIAIDAANGEVYLATPKGISRTSSVFKQGEPDYSKITVYPNPIIQHGDDPVNVTFTGLKQGSSLIVLTPSGRRVATIDASQFGATVEWNCRDENDKLLPTGVYLVGATTVDAPEFGMTKFVLVRQ